MAKGITARDVAGRTEAERVRLAAPESFRTRKLVTWTCNALVVEVADIWQATKAAESRAIQSQRSISSREASLDRPRFLEWTGMKWSFWLPVSVWKCGGQGRTWTADASLFRAAYRQC